jgi:hypothetical protein
MRSYSTLQEPTSMSENTNNGYVVEGDLNVAVKGQLVIYSITGGTMLYSNYIQQAKNLDLTQKYVPLPRRPDDAFAKAKDNLNGLQLPSLDSLDGWDSVVERKLVVRPLKRGSEYAVSVELSGRSRGKRHKEVRNLYRISFTTPDDMDLEEWRNNYANSFWDEEVKAPSVQEARDCISVEVYWEDDDLEDLELFLRVTNTLMDNFTEILTSVDSDMLRSNIRKVLMEMGGLPFKSGSGAWFIPNYSDEPEHLTELENYSSLLNHYGDSNALTRSSSDTYLDEDGKPRKWYRQKSNLRVMGYIDNERQLAYIRDDIQNQISIEITEFQNKISEAAAAFNEDKVEAFEKRLDKLEATRTDLTERLSNLSTLVGGDLDLNTTPFRDIGEGFASRIEAIGEDNSLVTSRLRSLMEFDLN